MSSTIVVGYTIGMEKSVIFLYISNEQFGNKIKKTISFTIASQRIKYLSPRSIRFVH